MFDWLFSFFGYGGNTIANLADVITSVVGTFAIIATQTKNKVDNVIAQWMMEIVNFLGMNMKRARNDPSV